MDIEVTARTSVRSCFTHSVYTNRFTIIYPLGYFDSDRTFVSQNPLSFAIHTNFFRNRSYTLTSRTRNCRLKCTERCLLHAHHTTLTTTRFTRNTFRSLFRSRPSAMLARNVHTKLDFFLDTSKRLHELNRHRCFNITTT